MPTLLVIDDEPAILQLVRLLFAAQQVEVITTTRAEEGVDLFARRRPDVVVLDVDLPDCSGLEIFLRLRRLDPNVPVIFITGQGTTATVIEAMALGAYDYVLKPFGAEQFQQLVGRALEASRRMRTQGAAPETASDRGEPSAETLVGRNPAMQEVYKTIGRVARRDVTVLITGESGTGKELVARAIYQYSRRASGPFLAINCAAIPETLLESELFGHEQGAFTGAGQRRLGKFEQCSGGTLFLDEIGEMAPLAQAKILRVLQEQQFERVGGNVPVQTDVRLIAATNRDLERMVAAGQFRQDLYYRLNVCAIRLPPLRERLDDLPLLVDYFLHRFRRELDKEVRGTIPEVLDLLRRYPWPGNLRELQSALKHAMLQATGPLLLPDFFHPNLRSAAEVPNLVLAPPPGPADDLDALVEERLEGGAGELYGEWLARAERKLFARVLRHTNGNLSQAARVLGIHRATLRSRLAILGLSVEERA
ncbi:MAG: sigma-54-dependent Fis family transcriptional regulator [Gemmataceae bacterium]|nr:sigma-54-dependent Fis family transcriptional regulator [Gemmataceae bacterium]